jgi:hypothetical protein
MLDPNAAGERDVSDYMSKYAIKDSSPADFFVLCQWFGQRWGQESTALRLWACKWRPEDLIPGLSDLDARVVCDDIVPEDWLRLDDLAYRAHLEVTEAHPEWARKLEHTPGVCCTSSDVLDPALFHPDMRTWDYYWGDHELFGKIKALVSSRPWGQDDEYYFLAQRFVPWCTPYNRSIDPPINIPQNILPKYALHSRAMHYFVPCVMAALSLVNRQAIAGKRESLYRWAQIYPNEPALQETIHLLDRHYEVPWLEDEQAWYAYEDRLWHFIQKITPEVLRSVRIVDLQGDFSLDQVQRKLKAYPGQPMMTLFNGVRFSRIRQGRWRFYLSAPSYFETEHVCQWEIRWLRSTFTTSVFDAYAQMRWGEAGLGLDEILARMKGPLIGPDDEPVIRRIFAAAAGPPATAEREARQRLRQVVDIYADYYLILERMLADARMQAAGKSPRTTPHEGVEQ